MTVKEFLEQIQKGTISTSTGGQLNTEDANKFINTVINQSQLLSAVSTRRNIRANTADIDTLALASRIMAAATEGVAGTGVTPTLAERTLTLTEVILPFDVTYSFLESNIEGQSVTTVLNNAFATAFANDTLDLATNGDTGSSGFVAINDGWLALAKASGSGAHTYDHNGTYSDLTGTVFPALAALLPNKWKQNRGSVAIMVSPTEYEDFLTEIGNRATQAGDNAILGGKAQTWHGYPVVENPFMPAGSFMMTPLKNLWVGYGRDITYEFQRQSRKRLIEYTLTARLDFQFAVGDALVIGYDA